MSDLSAKKAAGSVKLTGADPISGDESNFVKVDTQGNLYSNLRDSAGVEIGTRTNNLQTNLPSTVSTANSTVTPLGANLTFTGTSEDVSDFACITVQLFTSHASAALGFKPQYSPNGTNWDDGDAYNIAAQVAGNGKFFTFPVQAKFFRIVYTNGATLQTAFRLQTIFHKSMVKASSHRIDDSLDAENDAELSKAIITGKRADGTFDTVKQTNSNELQMADIVDGGGLQGAITVGTTAVAIRVGGSNLANRKRLTFINNGTQTLYWGYTNAVTTASGTPIMRNQPVSDSWGPNTTIWIIATSGTHDVRVTEGAT